VVYQLSRPSAFAAAMSDESAACAAGAPETAAAKTNRPKQLRTNHSPGR
jgi:hypothetical protein